jgi:hypothetical protein
LSFFAALSRTAARLLSWLKRWWSPKNPRGISRRSSAVSSSGAFAPPLHLHQPSEVINDARTRRVVDAMGRIGASQTLLSSIRSLTVEELQVPQHLATARAEAAALPVSLLQLKRCMTLAPTALSTSSVVVVSSAVESASTAAHNGASCDGFTTTATAASTPLSSDDDDSDAGSGDDDDRGPNTKKALRRLPDIRAHHSVCKGLASQFTHVIVPESDTYSLLVYPEHARHVTAVIRSLLVPRFKPQSAATKPAPAGCIV